MSTNVAFDTSIASVSSPARAVWLLARVVWLEALRRKDLWVVALLMLVYLMGAVSARLVHGQSAAQGGENAAQLAAEAQFIFNLGLTVSFWLAAVLTALLGARELPAELEARTLYPLLAKPVRRSDVIVGKFAAIATVGMATLLAFAALTLLVSPWLPSYSPMLLAQCVALQALALAVLAALTLCLSVWAPTAIALIVGLGWFFVGGGLIGLIRAQAAGFAPSWRAASSWLCAYAPDFSQFDLSTRFTAAGPPMGMGEFLALCLSALIFAAAFLAVASAGFRRRSL